MLPHVPDEVAEHGHEGGQMHEHVEGQRGGGDVEELGHEHQVGRAGHGEELGEPLHYSEYESMEDGQILARSLSLPDTSACSISLEGSQNSRRAERPYWKARFHPGGWPR